MLDQRYKEILRQELVRRINQNPRYSLRAFARHLGIDPSQLSRVLKGQRHLSLGSARLVADRMFKNKNEQSFFVGLVEYSTSAKRANLREAALRRIHDLAPSHDAEANLRLETFEAISSWYHFAILDLVTIGREPWTVARIGRYLGLHSAQARETIQRLLGLGLLREKAGTLIRTHAVLSTPTDIPSQKLRDHHREMLAKASASIEEQTVDERYLRGKTMAISRRDLPALKELIEDFNREVSKLNSRRAEKDSLYQLNVQLFSLESKGKK